MGWQFVFDAPNSNGKSKLNVFLHNKIAANAFVCKIAYINCKFSFRVIKRYKIIYYMISFTNVEKYSNFCRITQFLIKRV